MAMIHPWHKCTTPLGFKKTTHPNLLIPSSLEQDIQHRRPISLQKRHINPMLGVLTPAHTFVLTVHFALVETPMNASLECKCFISVLFPVLQTDDICKPDVQVSANVCFTQAQLHNKNRIHNPPLSVVYTLFTSFEECEAIRLYVEDKRGTRQPNTVHEKGVAVINEVLDLCGDSFKATDENHLRGTKSCFDCTGVVACICQHGCVIWLINMMEVGKKQYYIFTLINKLIKELPINFTVGFLYDIACQLHHGMSNV
jgi:Kyakuja-Dileera-Zisupton transposase